MDSKEIIIETLQNYINEKDNNCAEDNCSCDLQGELCSTWIKVTLTEFVENEEMNRKIICELSKAIKKLGGKSDILAIIDSYGDTQTDEQILEMLEHWNHLARGIL